MQPIYLWSMSSKLTHLSDSIIMLSKYLFSHHHMFCCFHHCNAAGLFLYQTSLCYVFLSLKPADLLILKCFHCHFLCGLMKAY